jgi:site-specific DNA recombinase
VTEAVWHRFDSPAVVAALGDADDQGEMERIVRQIEFCQRKLDDFVDDYATGLLSRAQLARAKLRTHVNRERHQDQLAKLQPTTALPRQPQPEAWDSLRLDAQLAIIWLVVNRVLVQPGHPGTATWRRWRFDTTKVQIVWRDSAQ